MKRFLWLGLVLCLMAIWVGCGDTFRPIIIPNPPAFPDPRAAHTVIAVNNNNFTANQGTVMEIDVSGDSDIGEAKIGFLPVHAMQQTGTQVLAVNQFDASVTKLSFPGGVINPTTISLPQGSAPNFVAVAPNDTSAYVTMPKYFDPVLNKTVPSVAVVNTTGNNIPAIITVGNNPVALAVTRDRKRLYVANQGDSTVSGFNTIDRSLRNNPPIALGSPPIWVLARSDSQRVYVLEEDGTVATLDTTSTAGPDSVISTTATGSGASYMLYDGLLNRLYVPAADAQSNAELVVFDVSQSTPVLLKTVTLAASATPAAGVAVAALPDSKRVYAASNGPAQTTDITISSVSGDGTRATYTFAPGSGPALQLGMSLTIAGGSDGFDGTFIVSGVSGSTFEVANPTSGNSSAPRTGSGTNFLPVVTVINTSNNQIKTTINMPAVPAAGPYEAPVCSDPSTRFRFTMAAAGDSSRVYLASCDGGNIQFINTFDDTYLLSFPAPLSARAPIPPSSQPPSQNPVLLIAGP
jgi:DNA-binding beta-propeller fold protein YncE